MTDVTSTPTATTNTTPVMSSRASSSTPTSATLLAASSKQAGEAAPQLRSTTPQPSEPTKRRRHTYASVTLVASFVPFRSFVSVCCDVMFGLVRHRQLSSLSRAHAFTYRRSNFTKRRSYHVRSTSEQHDADDVDDVDSNNTAGGVVAVSTNATSAAAVGGGGGGRSLGVRQAARAQTLMALPSVDDSSPAV